MESTATPKQLEVYQERVQLMFQLDPQIPIVLKGKTLTLEFNNRAVKDVLKDCGFNALRDSLVGESMDDPNILGSLLHRGLQCHHPEMTVDDTDALFTSRHYPYVVNRLRAAMDLFLPDLSDVVELPPKTEGQEDPTLQPTLSG